MEMRFDARHVTRHDSHRARPFGIGSHRIRDMYVLPSRLNIPRRPQQATVRRGAGPPLPFPSPPNKHSSHVHSFHWFVWFGALEDPGGDAWYRTGTAGSTN